ncbi:MAG: hypothetical protein K6L81_03015 [Agarilytica sp.]
MVKQLKYFTKDPAAVKSATNALARQGFDINRLKVFSRDNSHHRYDGLLVESEHNAQTRELSISILFYVSFFMLGTLAISSSLISFTTLSFILIAIVVLAKLLSRSGLVFLSTPMPSKEVYFLIVDVDSQSEKMVSKIANAEPMLLSQ